MNVMFSLIKEYYAGLSIIALAILFTVITYSFTTEVLAAHTSACGCGSTCSMAENLPPQTIFASALIAALSTLGSIVMVSTSRRKNATAAIAESVNKVIKSLTEEEKRVYDLIHEDGGAAFQSDLLTKTGFNKIKVTRLLDKLEGKQLVERRRRGMTNLVLIKK